MILERMSLVLGSQDLANLYLMPGRYSLAINGCLHPTHGYLFLVFTVIKGVGWERRGQQPRDGPRIKPRASYGEERAVTANNCQPPWTNGRFIHDKHMVVVWQEIKSLVYWSSIPGFTTSFHSSVFCNRYQILEELLLRLFSLFYRVLDDIRFYFLSYYPAHLL